MKDENTKRKSDDFDNQAKKTKFNIWDNKSNTLTPPTTPNTKYEYNIWKKSNDDGKIKRIQISDFTISSW